MGVQNTGVFPVCRGGERGLEKELCEGLLGEEGADIRIESE